MTGVMTERDDDRRQRFDALAPWSRPSSIVVALVAAAAAIGGEGVLSLRTAAGGPVPRATARTRPPRCS